MANFNGTARSNYFRVKDAEAFKAWVSKLPNLVHIESNGLHGFYSDCPDSGCFPSSYFVHEDEDDEVEVDLMAEVGAHLEDGEVCVLMEAGSEKCRYIDGWASAFDNTGKEVHVSLNDIYDKVVEAFGKMPTEASY